MDAIKDYSTAPEKALIRDLTANIGSYISFLIECRPLSISMGNAIRFLKNRIAKLPLTLTESEAKVTLQSDIDRFINEKIILADKVIVRHAVTKIRDGDVLLTYGSSSVVEMILLYAHELGNWFRVVVVDSRPKLEGRSLLRRLVAKGDSDAISKVHGRRDLNHLSNWAELENLQLLSLLYDATPSDYVSMIVTDYGMVPPTSVPVIVQEYRREHLWI